VSRSFSDFSSLVSSRDCSVCVSRGLFLAFLFSILFVLYVRLRANLFFALELAGFGGEDFLILITCCFDQVFLYLAIH